MEEYLHADLTKEIISAFYEVYNTLGYGFLEKVYENSLMIELMDRRFKVENQKSISVHFKGRITGEYFADKVVGDKVILELKAVEKINEEHEFQLINYLKATEIEVGLLLNYGKHPQICRKVFSNKNKSLNLRRSA